METVNAKEGTMTSIIDTIDTFDTDAGAICVHDIRDLNAKFAFAAMSADSQTRMMKNHFIAYLRHTHDYGDMDFEIFLPSGRSIRFAYDESQYEPYKIVGTNYDRDDLFAYMNAVRAIIGYIETL